MSFQTLRRTPYGCIMLQRAKSGEHALIVNPSGRYRALYGGVVFHSVGSDVPLDADMLAADLVNACEGQHDRIMSHAMRQMVNPVPSAEYRNPDLVINYLLSGN